MRVLKFFSFCAALFTNYCNLILKQDVNDYECQTSKLFHCFFLSKEQLQFVYNMLLVIHTIYLTLLTSPSWQTGAAVRISLVRAGSFVETRCRCAPVEQCFTLSSKPSIHTCTVVTAKLIWTSSSVQTRLRYTHVRKAFTKITDPPIGTYTVVAVWWH